MKFIISREAILPPLQQIVSVIEKRQTMPILSNVLVTIDYDHLILTGTDLEIQLIAKINGASKVTAGSITVPAKKFLDICRLLPKDADIKFELPKTDNMDKVKITSGRSKFSLNCLPAENYPDFAESEFKDQLSINAGKLKKALDKTLFCMANQDVRYYLNGVMVSISNGKLKLAASDGSRLATYEDDIDHSVDMEASIILPRKGALELSRLLDDPDAELKVEFSRDNIKVFNKNIVFLAKLIDGKYPDFRKAFHQEFLNPIQIQRQVLKDALTRVAILSNEKFKGVTFDISSSGLNINTHNPENDEAEEELAIQYMGEPVSISFNAQFVLDAVSNLDAEIAVLTIATNTSTCFIEDPNASDYKFIVMPIRT